MATLKGDIFNVLLATIPPSIIFPAYALEWKPITHASPTRKAVFLLACLYIVYYKVYNYFTSPFRHITSPPNPHFILGHGYQMLSQPPGNTPLRWMKSVTNNGLLVFRGFFHGRANILLTTPETAMEVLNTRAYDWEKPPPARKFFSLVLGDGLLNVEGNEHKQQRRNIAPAFSGKQMKALVPLFWRKAQSLAEAVKKEAEENDGVVEIPDLASRATMDIIGSAGLGKDFRTLEDGEIELGYNFAQLTDPKKGSLVAYFTLMATLPTWLVRSLPMKTVKRVEAASAALKRLTKEMLEEKKQHMQGDESDLIATLIASQAFTTASLTDQLITFLAAGHDTTASALTWTTYLLSKHPQIQSRLRADCRTAAAAHQPFTSTTLDALPYLDAVTNEVLRLYPTVPNTARVAARRTTLATNPIPKGTLVIISPWAMHRLPSLWGPSAEEFDPERWMKDPKYGGASSPYAFQTFIHGPRSCIGQVFARNELKCLVAALVMRFELRLRDPGYEPVQDGAITIKPKDGMSLVVREV